MWGTMKSSPPPVVQLTLISSHAAQGLFAMLAVAAVLVALLEAGSGMARPFDTWGCLVMGAVFAALALAVRFERAGVITAQRLGVAAFGLYLISSLQQVWFGGSGAAVDPYAVASTSAWLLFLNVAMFLCLPRARAATAALVVAGLAALFPWLPWRKPTPACGCWR